ncbi:MAG: hypothetical protein II662_06350 [Bacteroidales bacterium]|nr:hypothetical protein [Bacteroidales bacterium]
MSNQAKYDSLRATFESFIYEDFHYSVENGEFSAVFDFVLKPQNIEFHPCFRIPSRSFYHWNDIPKPLLDNIIVHIGMIELISYWKIACPKQVIVKPFVLDEEQIKWWKKLYFNGLGEFFYVNGIQTNINDFMTIMYGRGVPRPCKSSSLLTEQTLIPVGGGKDSVVTLELLKNCIPAIPLIINPRGATNDCVAAAGYTEDQTAIIKRTLDPTMLKMNAEGYLNGHTPFSAMLAFYTVLLGFATKSKYIALSNESSANEPTVPDTEINHQYSKSVAFENDFRQYVKKYIDADIQYFSFLRPLNELQIARFFSRAKDYHKVFRSCNAGSKTDSWCGKCPKCLFTWLALSPFLKRSELTDIFGKDLLKDNDLRHTLDQLDGSVEVKPFECVGTVGEVRACVNKILQTDDNLRDTILDGVAKTDDMTVEDYVAQFDEGNNLPELFKNIMKEALNG